MLCAFTYKGNGAAEIERRRKRIEQLARQPAAQARRRHDPLDLHPRRPSRQLYDPAVPEAIIAVEMKFGDTVPSGTYLDMAANLPIVDPTKVLSPVLMMRGEFDGNSTNDGPARFLPAAAERRPPVRHPAADRAQPGLQQEPASAVLRDAQFPRLAGAARGIASGFDATCRGFHDVRRPNFGPSHSG